MISKNWVIFLKSFILTGKNFFRAALGALKRDLALINARSRKALNFHFT